MNKEIWCREAIACLLSTRHVHNGPRRQSYNEVVYQHDVYKHRKTGQRFWRGAAI